MKTTNKYLYGLCAFTLTLLGSCEDKSNEFGAVTIKEAVYSNNHMELRLQDNETLPLTIFTMPQTKNPVNVTYIPAHPEWLTVENNVLIPTPFSGGATIYDPTTRTDTLTVTLDNLSVNYLVVITNHIKRVREIVLTAEGSNILIKKGGGENGTFNLAAALSFNPSDAYNQAVTYTSADESIATVSEDGIVTSGDQVGSTEIIITSQDGSGVTRTANVTVLDLQPVDLDRTGWRATTSAALEPTGFNYIPKGIGWVPDKVAINGVHTLVGSPADMFDGNNLTYFNMEKPGKGNYSCVPGTSGWNGDNQDYGDMLTDLILSLGGDPSVGTGANPDTDAVNYFVVDMTKEQEFSYIMWCHRNAANNRILTFDIYGSNNDDVYTETAASSEGKWTKLNSSPIDVSEVTTNAEQRIDINEGQEFKYRYIKIVALTYPASGMTFGVSELNFGVNR